MDYGLILARILHVVLGVLWVGSMYFVTVFLMPPLGEAGPDAGKVVTALARRKYMIFIPVVAIINMLSGIWLYWKVSSGFAPEYMGSGPGQTYGVGAVLAIIAFILGVTITRPAMMKATELAQAAMSAAPTDREALLAQAQALRARAASVGRVILALLMGTAISMSIGRYV